MTKRRRIAAFLCALFLFALRAGAVSHEELLFIAAEDMVLPLSDDMAFFYQGYLYISSDFFTGAVRDALGVAVARIGDSVLVYRGEQSLLFRGHYAYAQDSEQNNYAPGMILRGENAYVPAAMVARYFDLLYSTTDVEHGKLIWLRKPSFPMKEKAFARAAASQLNIVYQEYLRASEPEPAPPQEPEAQDFFAPEVVTGPEEFAPVLPEPAEETPNPAAPVETPAAPDSYLITPPSVPASDSHPLTPPSLSASDSHPLTPPSVSASDSNPLTPPSVSASDSNPLTPPSVSVQTPKSFAAQTPKSLTPSASDSPSVTLNPSAAPDNASAPPDSESAPRGEQTIYLCLRADENTSALLDALDRHHLRATVFCDETFLAEQGDLLRRVTATGYRVGLYLSSASAASALAQLETCNLLLQRTTMEKTRLVFADGAGEETLRAIRNAGFVCLLPDTKLDGAPLRTSRQASDFLKRVSRDSAAVAVWLDGTVSASGLDAFVNRAQELDDAFLPWTEGASA